MYNVIFDLYVYMYIVYIEEDVPNYILLFLSFLFSFTMCIKCKFNVLHESVNVHKTTCTCTHNARIECLPTLALYNICISILMFMYILYKYLYTIYT